jgi:hypothetical protein
MVLGLIKHLLKSNNLKSDMEESTLMINMLLKKKVKKNDVYNKLKKFINNYR